MSTTPAAVTRDVAEQMAAIVGASHCISEDADLRTYECDGLTGVRVRPALVVLPGSTKEVSFI